jgi:hypothetical protein
MEAATGLSFCDGNVFSECTDYKEGPNGYVCCDELPGNYVVMNYMFFRNDNTHSSERYRNLRMYGGQ